MPEEAWVLKCYSCNKFQVQLKKKAKKWQCKVCGKKQDLMTIFFKGQPKDCRINVQNLNKAEGERYEKMVEQSEAQYYSNDSNEEVKQSSHSDFFNDEEDIFTEEALAQVDEECEEIEKYHSQKKFKSPDNFSKYCFNKSQPKDCKTNEHNLNNVEEEKYDKLRKQSQTQEYDYYAKEQTKQSPQSDFFNDEEDIFTEEALAQVDEECEEIEKYHSQKKFKLSDNFSEVKNSGLCTISTCTTENTQSNLPKTNEINYEVSSVNHEGLSKKNICNSQSDTIHKSSVNNKDNKLKLQEPKISIFESYDDFEEIF